MHDCSLHSLEPTAMYRPFVSLRYYYRPVRISVAGNLNEKEKEYKQHQFSSAEKSSIALW